MAKSKFYKNVYIYLTIGLIIVFLGFSTSYFGRLSQSALPYHIHGISATLWMIILIVQPFLYTHSKLKVHKYLGWSTLILVPTLVLAGMEMIRLMIQNQKNYPPDIVYNLAFIDVTTLLGFVLLYVLALHFRKRLRLHARLMVCTLFGPLVPALTRVFFILNLADDFNQSLTFSFAVVEIVLLFIIWIERKQKEAKLTYLPVLIFTIFQHLLMYFAGNWSWWSSLVNTLTGYQ